jgi:hypothetical protein
MTDIYLQRLTSGGAIRTLMIATLIAGSLDATAAIVIYNVNPVNLFKFIASGALGPHAFSGGSFYTLLGIFFHYFITLFWTFLYYLAYPALKPLRKNKLLAIVGFGIVIWCGMNIVVLPLSKIAIGPFEWEKALLGLSILIVAVSLPITLIVNSYFKNRPL